MDTNTKPAYTATTIGTAGAYFQILLDLADASDDVRGIALRLTEDFARSAEEVDEGLPVAYTHRNLVANYATAVDRRRALTTAAEGLFGKDDKYVARAFTGDKSAPWDYANSLDLEG